MILPMEHQQQLSMIGTDGSRFSKPTQKRSPRNSRIKNIQRLHYKATRKYHTRCILFLFLLALFCAHCNNYIPKSMASWVDPDTPEPLRRIQPLTKGDQREFELVFSDEFNQDGRTMQDGNDPRWTAIDKNDYTNLALHYYRPDNVRTSNGVLNISTLLKSNWYKAFDEEKKTFFPDQKFVQTGMVQSWNKFCFIGGIVEFRAQLPGDPKVGGLWPALWILGNLARATYVGSADYMWPFSYNQCDTRTRQSQEISACKKVNHYGLAAYQGRGAPEIDIIESMQGSDEILPSTHIRRPYQSASLQVAPGVEIDRPSLGHRPHKGNWYTNLEYGKRNSSDLNPFFYGVTLVHDLKSHTYQSDAISANLQLNESHYKRQNLYRVEWEPPDVNGTGGYIKWFTDNEMVFGVNADSLDIMKTEIPSEPMYLLMNVAVSSHWGFPQPCPDNCDCKCYECGNPACLCALPTGYCNNFPAYFEIDYVRVYQAVNESRHFLGCSPEHRPTEQFIEGHIKRYVEDGQSRPLLPIQIGGGACETSDDCGGHPRGVCSDAHVCVCEQGWVGLNCLAQNGFYDEDTRAQIPPFSFFSMILPRSLLILIVLLILIFSCSLCGTVRFKSVEAARFYQKIPTVSSPAVIHDVSNYASPVDNISSPYHHPHNQYALPAKQNEVTYCVIDGRLVDS